MRNSFSSVSQLPSFVIPVLGQPKDSDGVSSDENVQADATGTTYREARSDGKYSLTCLKAIGVGVGRDWVWGE